jgi:nickel-dependent lactate racemase
VPEFQLPYGKTYQTLTLPDDRHVELIAPREIAAAPDPTRLVEEALDQPVGGVGLGDFSDAQSAAVVISDKTRPIPHAALYPLLARLEKQGLPPDAITFLVANGSHAPMQPEEFTKVLPDDLLARYAVISHDCDDDANLVHLGQTLRGTPVWVNRHFVQADVRIVVGNIEPHQIMGFSGGAKSAAIGVAGRETINTNHRMMTDPRSRLGEYENNPARQDVEEIGRLMGVHLALNTILNRDKQIVHVLAGEPVAVMEAGIPRLCELVEVHVSAPFDLVITSPGGHPKDINLHQSQKALAHASLIAKDGGVVILVAACPEGTGSEGYERWMQGMNSYKDILDRFAREPFRLGPHKAFQIARDAARVCTLLVSDMPPDQVQSLLLTPASSLDEIIPPILSDLAADARIGVMLAANATLPVMIS